MSSDGARDNHSDNGDDHKMIKCSTWEIKAKILLRVLVLVIKTP